MVKGSKKTKKARALEAMFEEITAVEGSWTTGVADMATDEQPAEAALAEANQGRHASTSGADAMMDVSAAGKPHRNVIGKRGKARQAALRVAVNKPLKIAVRGNNTAAQKKRRQQILDKALTRHDKLLSRVSLQQGVKVRKLSMKKMY